VLRRKRIPTRCEPRSPSRLKRLPGNTGGKAALEEAARDTKANTGEVRVGTGRYKLSSKQLKEVHIYHYCGTTREVAGWEEGGVDPKECVLERRLSRVRLSNVCVAWTDAASKARRGHRPRKEKAAMSDAQIGQTKDCAAVGDCHRGLRSKVNLRPLSALEKESDEQA